MDIDPAYLRDKLAAANIKIGSVRSDGTYAIDEKATLEEKELAAGIAASVKAFFENPPVYQDRTVFSADYVDRITIQRIRNLIRPDTGDPELQASAELRQLKNAVVAGLFVNQFLVQVVQEMGVSIPPEISEEMKAIQSALAQNAEVDAIRAEGIAFKVAQGWHV